MTTNSAIHSIQPNLQLQNPRGLPADLPCVENHPGRVEVLYPLAQKAGVHSVERCLEKQSLLRLTGDHSGEQFFVVSGMLWITQSGKSEDIFLREGEAMEITQDGAILVEGMVESRLIIRASSGSSTSGRNLGDAVRHFLSGLQVV